MQVSVCWKYFNTIDPDKLYKILFKADNGTLIKSNWSALVTQIKGDQIAPDTQIKSDRSTLDSGGILYFKSTK